MFTVEWAIKRGKNPPEVVQRDASQSDDLATVLASAKARLSKLKALHPKNPPNGFIVLDGSGKEVSRWFPADHSQGLVMS